MWNKVMAFAKLFDVLAVAVAVIFAFACYIEGAPDKAIFWMVTALFFGRGQVHER